jgi:hypothetical protein
VTIIMRETLNVKPTQIHPGDPSYGWKWKAFLDDLSIGRAQRNEGREKGMRDRGFNQNLFFYT